MYHAHLKRGVEWIKHCNERGISSVEGNPSSQQWPGGGGGGGGRQEKNEIRCTKPSWEGMDHLVVESAHGRVNEECALCWTQDTSQKHHIKSGRVSRLHHLKKER